MIILLNLKKDKNLKKKILNKFLKSFFITIIIKKINNIIIYIN